MPSAEYMREYRKRRKATEEVDTTPPLPSVRQRIGKLEEEVAHLLRQLAEHPVRQTEPPQHQRDTRGGDSFTTFRPAPKPGRK